MTPERRIVPADLEHIDAQLAEIGKVATYYGAAASYSTQLLHIARQLRTEVDRVNALRAELAAEYERACDQLADARDQLNAPSAGGLPINVRYQAAPAAGDAP